MFLAFVFQGPVQQLYISSCPGTVSIQTQVNAQCTSQPADCTLPFVPITKVFQGLSVSAPTLSVSCNCLFTCKKVIVVKQEEAGGKSIWGTLKVISCAKQMLTEPQGFTLPQGFTSTYMTSPAWSPSCPLCYLDSFRWFCSSCCLKSTIAIAMPLGRMAQISISPRHQFGSQIFSC